MSSYRTFNKAKCLKMKPNNYSQQQLRTQSDWQFTLDTKPNNRMRKPKDTHLKPFDSHQALSIWKQKLQEVLHHGLNIEEEKTILEDEDVGPQPSTTPPPTTQLIQMQPTIQNTNNNLVLNLCSHHFNSSTNHNTSTTALTNSQLRNTDRRDCTWWPFTTIYNSMEIDNNSPLATIRNSTWIQNSIFETTSTLESTEKALICRRPITRKHSNPKILNGRDDRSITIPKQELPFQLFYFTGTDQEKANFGLSKTQQLSTSGTFQDGGRAGITRDNRRKRLHLQNRLKRCIRHHTYPSRLSRLPKLRKPRHCISL
ncbi:hypothetical protein G6F43_010059 [Rhizopus delemar]|nr:hypothetical protein G6F43_010059 [Rhizopus delemar]